MRVFIAVDLPPEAKEGVERVKLWILKKLSSRLKPVERENFHYTLKFIGEVAETQLREAVRKVREAVEAFPGFSVGIAGFGAFPKLSRARVLWLGAGEGAKQLVELSEKVDRAISDALGIKVDVDHIPHLTIARVKAFASRDAEVLERVRRDLEGRVIATFEVREITVFESILRKAGPVYRPVERINLGEG